MNFPLNFNLMHGRDWTNPADPNHQYEDEVPLPFDPNIVKKNAMRLGLSDNDAWNFAQMVIDEFRTQRRTHPDAPTTNVSIANAFQKQAEIIRQRHEQAEEAEKRSAGATIAESMQIAVANASSEFRLPLKDDAVTVETIRVNGQNRQKYKFSQEAQDQFFDGQDPYKAEEHIKAVDLMQDNQDMITALCNSIELAVELAKHLAPKDIINLYCANRAFHNAIKGHLMSSVRMWIAYNAPEAGKIFPFQFYKRHLIEDPMGRTYGQMYEGLSEAVQPPIDKRNEVRAVPGLKYLQLVIGRDRCCRDILAIMARNGHRMPSSMHSTLLRLWLYLEISTTRQRQAIIRNKTWWSDHDLYNAQFFLIKLAMHFNDPVFGPSTHELVQLMMGQKGLYPLWQLLTNKKYTNLREFVQLKVRYDFRQESIRGGREFFELPFYSIPADDVGIGHTEGWGTFSNKHLVRPDESIPMEAVRRGLELDRHLMYMVTWGYFDVQTGENLVPTEEEMYIEDEAEVLENMDTTDFWQRKHALKKRWASLTEEQRREIMDEDEDERLRALAWGQNIEDFDDIDCDFDDYSICSADLDEHFNPADPDFEDDEGSLTDDDFFHPGEPIDDDPNSEPYTLDDEINRGFRLRPQPADQPSTAPAKDDKQGWADFVNKSLMSMPVELNEDEEQVMPHEPFDMKNLEVEQAWEKALRAQGYEWRAQFGLLPY